MKVVKESNDAASIEYGDSQESQKEREEIWIRCDGILDEAGTKFCKVRNIQKKWNTEKDDCFTHCLFYRQASGEEKYFCKASHLIRFLIPHHKR